MEGADLEEMGLFYGFAMLNAGAVCAVALMSSSSLRTNTASIMASV